MNIFKFVATLAITFVCLAVFGVVIMCVAVNPHVLVVIGLVAGSIVQVLKRK